jgi:hypothetical protein
MIRRVTRNARHDTANSAAAYNSLESPAVFAIGNIMCTVPAKVINYVSMRK